MRGSSGEGQRKTGPQLSSSAPLEGKTTVEGLRRQPLGTQDREGSRTEVAAERKRERGSVVGLDEDVALVGEDADHVPEEAGSRL